LVLEEGDAVRPQDAVGRYGLTVRYQSPVKRIAPGPEGSVLVESAPDTYLGTVCAIVERADETPLLPPYELPESLSERIHYRSTGLATRDLDVLVVGPGERAIAAVFELVESDARVVLCFTGEFADLSALSRHTLSDLERRQLVTVLWRSAPSFIDEVGGYPMAVFDDRRTPDLQFDHVVFALGVAADPPLDGLLEPGAPAPDGLFVFEDDAERAEDHLVPSGRAWETIRSVCFPHLPDLAGPQRSIQIDAHRVEELRAEHYNATITRFDTAHSELWRLRVRPDGGQAAWRVGQYCTLGVGAWEPRIDDVDDPVPEANREKLVRRSYSISSPLFDTRGYMVDPVHEEEIELYVVLVAPDDERIPGLTPRLALKRVGDRIYLGPKMAGRYTLDAVDDPATPVLFLSTGTGEAPHNAMVVELLRKGHYGPILSAVSVRYPNDLAYIEEHRLLEQRYANYHYLPVITRDPGGAPKRYLQELAAGGSLAEALGTELDPATTHVYLCGNPAMIGLPEWDGDQPTFPETVGMCQILHEMGFTIDRRGVRGNVHYEEYW
jgi:ferredoxin/flavodoxin---NADP+ reductase